MPALTIQQPLLFDGSMFARPCDGERNVESRPVAVPVGADATLALSFRYARSFAAVWPEALAGCTRFRFSVWADGGTLLYATAALVPDADARTLSVPFGGSWTEPMKEALGTAPSRVFRAELDGFHEQADTAPAFVVAFPLAVGNRLDTGADTTPLDNLGFRYIEEYASRSAFPATGEAGKIYVALDTNKTYRWSGSEYVQVGGGDPPVLSVNGKIGAVMLAASDVGAATEEAATLTENEFTAWEFADGLLAGAQENLPAIGAQSHLEIRAGSMGSAGWLVRDDGTRAADFCSVSISSDGTTATMTSGIPWATEIVPVGSALATRNAVRNYRLGPEYGPNADKPLAPAENYALKSELGTAASKDVPASGDATAQQVVTGSDSRLSNARPPTAHTHSSIVDGNTTVSAVNGGTATITKSGTGNASVTFPPGFSITYYGETYSTADGETIEFVGPYSVSNITFWVPSDLPNPESFDPSQNSVWCLYSSGPSATEPAMLMFGTSVDYVISDWDTATPSLILNNGEASGGAPTMARDLPVTKAVATEDKIPALAAPSTAATAQGKAADAKATGEALAAKAGVSDLPASETWTFTVDDGQGGTTTLTKQVAVYAAQTQGAGA